jgi:hypothetical protein
VVEPIINKTLEKTMLKLKFIALTIMVVLGLSAAITRAEGPAVSGSASVDAMSNYVWRGFKLSNSVVIQPSAGITYGGFSANLWSNLDTDINDSLEHNETDVTLNYAFAKDKFSFDVGYIYYALESAKDTQEAYFTIGYDTLLSPTLTVYYDFDEGDGAFITASIGHDLDLGKNIALSLGASASYNIESEYSIGDYSDFHNADLSASLSIPVTDAISAGPMIAYSFALSNDAEDAMEVISDDGDDSIIYGGVNVTLAF